MYSESKKINFFKKIIQLLTKIYEIYSMKLSEIHIRLKDKLSSSSITEIQNEIKSFEDKLNDGFDIFEEKTKALLDEASKVIQEKLESDPSILEDLLSELIPIYSSIGEYLVIAQNYLILYEVLYFCPKSKDLSEGDRKLKVEVSTIRQRIIVERLKNYDKKIAQKISAIQSILRYETTRLSKEMQ